MRFLTFGDGGHGFRAAGRRLQKQAEASGWFSGSCDFWSFAQLEALSPIESAIHKSFIYANSKGFGFWLWKPLSLKVALQQMKYGEEICMLDAGCQLNITPNSRIRFQEYREILSQNDMFLMQLQNGSFGISDLSEKAWTKKMLIEEFKHANIDFETGQYQSGIIFVKKTDRTIEFVEEWYQLCTKDSYRLLLSPSSNEMQIPQFREHRWEQSILSVLAKSMGIFSIPDETYFAPNWNLGERFPIWAMRNRSGGDAKRRRFDDLMKIAIARLL